MRLRCHARLALLAFFACASVGAEAVPQRRLTLDDIYDPARRIDVGSPFGPTATWISDTQYILPREVTGQRGRFTFVVVTAQSGAEAPLFDAAAFERALAAVPGSGPDDISRLAHQRSYAFTPAHDGLVVSMAEDLYLWRFGADHVVRLTSTPGPEEDAAFSPNGRLLAYTRGGNLYVSDLGGAERAVTTDGGPDRLNGRLDWVYEEEVYGRGATRGFWWSPDSSRLAYLQLDETAVPHFAIPDHVSFTQTVEDQRYPRPGEPNPNVRLGIVRALGGATTWADTGKYSDPLIVDVSWTPDSREAVFQVQNRQQTWLDLDTADASAGTVRTIFRETTPAWVNNLGAPVWLKDGSFLWLSERTGWNHLYHYTRDGSLARTLTSGDWEIRNFYGVDEAGGWAYFSATERSPIGTDVYRVKLTGGPVTRLSGNAGSNAAVFNPSRTLYVGTWSDVVTPPQVRLHRADGTELRVVDKGEVKALEGLQLTKPEFVQVATRDGFQMNAMIIRPPGFDPARKYPVLQQTYAGPHAPMVRNAWGGTGYMYNQLLAQQGIIVWVCDNRSASGKGAKSAWVAYKRLGETELADIEDGLAWLAKQPGVDRTRIGLSGWSYGGFMTTYALTHSKSFVMGIAGGSVTDWRQYDSIYTERYMLTPQENPEGYARTAPRAAAANLSGRLLLLHGMMDDNVHMQNTVQLAYELQNAGKTFQLMLYPRSRHGVTDPRLAKHMRQLMLDFTLETLRPDGTAPRSTAAGAAGPDTR